MAQDHLVSNTDPVLDAPYGDAALRLGVLDAATLVRAKQEQKALRKIGVKVSLRQLLIRSGVLSEGDQALVEARLGISVRSEAPKEAPVEMADAVVDVLIDPDAARVEADADSNEGARARDTAEVLPFVDATPVPDEIEGESPPPMVAADEALPQGSEEPESLVFEETPEMATLMEKIAGNEGEHLEALPSVATTVQGVPDSEATVELASLSQSEAPDDSVAAPASESSRRRWTNVPEGAVGTLNDDSKAVEVSATVHAAEVPTPTIIPAVQPKLTPEMIAAAAGTSHATSSKKSAPTLPTSERPWYRRPTRLTALGLMIFVVSVLAGTAYWPEAGFSSIFLPKRGETSGFKGAFGSWNSFAAKHIGGKLHVPRQ